MPGFAWYTPDLSGVFHYRLLRVDSGLLTHVGWLLGELTKEYNWHEDKDTIADVVDASQLSLDLYFLNPMIGMVQGFMGAIPAGWLDLDGSTYDQADYPLLSERLGAVYRNDTAGTFTLPDFAGLFGVGAGGWIALGDEGGAASHTLTTSEIPSHTHSYTMPVASVDTVGVGAPLPVVDAATPGTPTGASGGGASHENMPPYHALNFGVFAGVV